MKLGEERDKLVEAYQIFGHANVHLVANPYKDGPYDYGDDGMFCLAPSTVELFKAALRGQIEEIDAQLRRANIDPGPIPEADRANAEENAGEPVGMCP